MKRKIIFSATLGLLILLATLAYQRSFFSFSIEDGFFKKFAYWKYNVFGADPRIKTDFLFINTGKDLTLVNDTTEYGNIAISNREKIYELLKLINSHKDMVRYVVLDIQFYFPYSVNTAIDTLMQQEISKNPQLLIPIIKGSDGIFKTPLYKAQYGFSGYTTYGFGFNKFKIWDHSVINSIPVLLHKKLNNAQYQDRLLNTTCNGHLCFTAIWPSFYLTDKQVKENTSKLTQSYNLGELLILMEANPEEFATIFKNRIVIIGNFADDNHFTPVGVMSGPVLLANIYLSLLNMEHLVSYLFLFILWISFSFLTYLSWYHKMPEIKFKFNFIFSPDLIKFISGYISYFGSMFFLSLIALFFFNMHVALFLPSFIFTWIEYFRQRKYLPKPSEILNKN
ncbi:MAG: CHASE2 domain-containing protein [Bacteroidetes bacterium]|nr:CHASE2 domain-containing protein [Bacteroidota bacterium]